ncbi:MAG: AMP-binding protein [Clostridia bacterium]|nr:AMP-binding protein [Clostridia bacterium]
MKLAFSTDNWNGYSVREFIKMAHEYKFSGIELHSVSEVTDSDLSDLYREMIQNKIVIPCIDLTYDVFADLDSAREEFDAVVKVASKLHIPYVRIKSTGDAAPFISDVIETAENNNIVLLVETVGEYADTGKLRELLESFASDTVGALWDLYYPYRVAGESPETTITNLGAFVKHIHIKDSDDAGNYSLVGEGTLPTDDIVNALKSVNYDGFISLEWNPEWADEIDTPDIIFPHFTSYMSRYRMLAQAKKSLYENKAGTGKFVWKKEALIEKTFSDVLDTMVKEFPNQYAFKYTTLDYTRTYSEFRDDVDEFARSLIALGVKAGTHVALWATNVPQWYIAFWATTKIGAVLVTVNTAYKIHEAEYLLKQSDTHTLIMIDSYRDSNYAEIMQELCPELQTKPKYGPLHSKRLPFLRNIITVGFTMKGALTWEKAIEAGKSVSLDEVRMMANAVDVHSVCNMQYTSGTTGFPKGVMLTHYNVVNNGKCIGDRMDLSTADRMMIQVPMFHCFGMVLAMTATMTHGGTCLPLPYFSPKSALSCVNREHITAFHGVPTMFIAMLEHDDFDKTDFSYMRTGIMAGSPCPEPIMNQVINKMNMKEITIVYGQTEASPGCTMSSADDPIDVRVATVGRPLPEIECKIIDPETGEDLPDNMNGEFVARGYNVMKGYYKMPEATANTIDKDGWLHTGDLALRTPEGNYRITGRLKDMIIRGGENIYPKELEEFIYTHEAVKDVQVIGIPDEQYGEEIVACIILKDGYNISEQDMKDYFLARMAKHKCPKYISYVTEFPMNAAGKILKYKMREQAAEKFGLKKLDGIVAD